MTTAAPPRHRTVNLTVVAVIAAAVSAAASIPIAPLMGTTSYGWALTVVLAIAAAVPAAIDIRQRKLPNRWVAPIATAGAAHAIVFSIETAQPALLVSVAISALVTFVVYLAMAFAGWTGFGDAKFAASLTITTALYAGTTALYLVAVAIAIGGARQLVGRVSGSSGPRAHGPDIAAAAVILLATGVAVSM